MGCVCWYIGVLNTWVEQIPQLPACVMQVNVTLQPSDASRNNASTCVMYNAVP